MASFRSNEFRSNEFHSAGFQWVGKTVANVKQVPNRGQKERNGFNFRETRANLQSALELRVVLGLCIHPQDVTPLE